MDELTKADEQIKATEEELGRFDSAFLEVDGESGTAAQFVRQAASKVEHAESEKEEVKQRSGGHMNERHDLQVCHLEKLNETIGSLIIFLSFHFRVTGPTASNKRICASSRI